jgi:hypothetical protein
VPENFAQVAFNTITNHGTTNLPADRDTHAGCHGAVYAPDKQKAFYGCFIPDVRKLQKLNPLPQARGFGKSSVFGCDRHATDVTWLQFLRKGSCVLLLCDA